MVAQDKDLSDSFPEIAFNQHRIRKIKEVQRRQLLHVVSDEWGKGRPGFNQHLFGWRASGFFDTRLVGSDLARRDLQGKLEAFGGKDHAKCVARLIQEAAARSSGVDTTPLRPNHAPSLDHRFYADPVNLQARAQSSFEMRETERSRRIPKTWAASHARSPLRDDPCAPGASRKLKVTKPKGKEMAKGLEAEERDIRLERMLSGVSSPVQPVFSPMAQPRPENLQVAEPQRQRSSNALAPGQVQHGARFLGDEAAGEAGAAPQSRGDHGHSLAETEEAELLSRPTRGHGDESGGAFSPLLATRALHAAHLSPLATVGGARVSNVDIARVSSAGKTVAGRRVAGEEHEESGWGKDVMALRAAAGKGERGLQKLKLVSPLSALERNVLSMSPWRQAAARIDAHDQAVLTGMPYRAHATLRAEGALRSLGHVVQSRDAQVRIAALAAIGDKANFGDPTCLAHIVPLLSDPDPAVKAAALRAVEQVAEPGQSRSYMEIEVEVFGASHLPQKDPFGACDGYVTLELRNERTGQVAHRDRTRIVWRDLHPRWKQTYYWEVRCPEEEEIGFTVWDEDGERDDLVGRCLLPISMIEFDEASGARPLLSQSLQLLAEDRETPILGYNDASFQNDGKPSKLHIRARYVAYLRPKDLMDAFVGLLHHESAETRAAALRTVTAFGLPGDAVVRASLVRMLTDCEGAIRMAAMRSLEEFVERNDEATMEQVAGLMEHEEERVRLAALAALGRICDKGNRVAIREVLARMYSHSPQVQQLVPDAITVVAHVTDARARAALVDALEEERADVRECALLTLLKMSEPGDLGLLEQVKGVLDDASHVCRWAAVNVIARLGSVTPEQDQAAKQRAEELLRRRATMDHGAGDPSPVVRQALQRKLEALGSAMPMTFVMAAAPIGQYSATLPAGYVAYSKAQGVFSYPVDPMPVDTKFHSTLPYRPPTPPWEPRAQAKKALNETMGKARKQLAVIQINIDDMTAEAARRSVSAHGLSVTEEMELEEKKLQAQALQQQIDKCAAELEELGGAPDVQPSNTTKLGFTIERATRKGDHCQQHDCMRSAFY